MNLFKFVSVFLLTVSCLLFSCKKEDSSTNSTTTTEDTNSTEDENTDENEDVNQENESLEDEENKNEQNEEDTEDLIVYEKNMLTLTSGGNTYESCSNKWCMSTVTRDTYVSISSYFDGITAVNIELKLNVVAGQTYDLSRDIDNEYSAVFLEASNASYSSNSSKGEGKIKIQSVSFDEENTLTELIATFDFVGEAEDDKVKTFVDGVITYRLIEE